MPWITIEEARENLTMWLDAERAISTGQSYKIGTRSLSGVAHRVLAQRNRETRKRPAGLARRARRSP